MVLAGVTWSKTKSATANWRNRWCLLPVEIQQGVICHTSVHCLKVITTVAAALRCVTFSGQSRCCDGNSTETFPGAWGLNLIGPFVYIKVKLIDTIFVNRICHHCCPPANATKDSWVWLVGFLFVFKVNQAGQKSNTSSNLYFCGSFEMRRVAKPFLRVYFFLSVCYLLTGKGVKTSNSCSIEKFLPHLKLFIEVLGIKSKIFVSAQIS